jgi:hypothetical protein
LRARGSFPDKMAFEELIAAVFAGICIAQLTPALK